MKKYWFLFIFLSMAITITQVVQADDFEWYTMKDEISGGINFRSEPSLDSKVLKCMILDFHYVVPLFKVVEKRPDGWYKVQSNRNGVARNINYQYKYFWVAGWLLRKVDPKKEKLGILVPADYEYSVGIAIYQEPHIFSCPEWRRAIPNQWKYIYASVKMTGKRIGPFIEIIQPCGLGKGDKSFVLGEYFGLSGLEENDKYLEFSIPKIFYTRSTCLDNSYYSGSLVARVGPSILSKKAGNYASGGIQVEVIGEQGHFYKTSKNKWIFKQCLVDP